jgi:predicted metal-dependent peptidase
MAEEQLNAMGELLDEHVDWGEGDNDSTGDGNGKPSLTREEQESIKNDVKENIVSAAQASGAGNIPAEINRLIKDLTESKLDWKDILQQQIQSTVRNNYTFARPSRKGWGSNIIIPGMDRDETIDVAISLDTSGSITDEQIKDFLSEVKGIMDQYSDYKIDLWTFDTKVYNHVTYTSDDSDEIVNYDIIGGGGTDFEAVWEYMKDNGISPKKLIMFSDMHAYGSFGDPDYCDTIFINHGRPGFEAPFGLTIPYDVS